MKVPKWEKGGDDHFGGESCEVGGVILGTFASRSKSQCYVTDSWSASHSAYGPESLLVEAAV